MSESNVVTTGDVAPVKVPKSFNDLNKPQLVAAAEYFGTETEGNAAALKADLLENGVTFDEYLKAFHPTEAQKAAAEEKDEFFMPDPVDVNDWPDAEGVEEVIHTAPAVAELTPQEKYLIRFIGDNPYFERGPYRFSQENPYAVMPAAAAQAALVEEPTKFRQAFPAELQEFFS